MTGITAVFARSAFAAIVGAIGLVAPARAAPPTVVPSPGYDARLQEQRARMAASPATVSPVPATRGSRKRGHHRHEVHRGF
jgi:hypothetical protein